MRIALIDMDNMNKNKISFPNLPLMKMSAYHKSRGDTVEWWCALERYDIAYKSRIFDFTPELQYPIMAEKVIEGGTGYGLENKLSDEIERIEPDYSIYPQFKNMAYGFLTRGCPNKCPFCVVSKKEGEVSRQVAELSDFLNGRQIVKLLDPNLLACKNHEAILQQLVESGSQVDFTQGLDIRLTTDDNVQLLKRIKIKQIHFAWDSPKQDLTSAFKRFKSLSEIKDYRKLGVYVLTNYNSTHEEDLYRVNTLRELGYQPYIMIFDKSNAPRKTRLLQRWVNNRIIFSTVKDFSEYDASKG